jgi:hypothetical protein
MSVQFPFHTVVWIVFNMITAGTLVALGVSFECIGIEKISKMGNRPVFRGSCMACQS